MVQQTSEHQQNVEKVRDLIKGIHIAMLTTEHQSGFIHSRPMATREVEFDGDLWFITGKDSEKASDLRGSSRVNVSFQDAGKGVFVSASGSAMLVDDRAKIHDLWTDLDKTWFPNGKDDPNITLIKVSVESAEYWESPGKIKLAIGFVKAALTKETPDDLGENKTVNLKGNGSAGLH